MTRQGWTLLLVGALMALCAGGVLRLMRVPDHSPLSWRNTR
jgi:hypothetical protein